MPFDDEPLDDLLDAGAGVPSDAELITAVRAGDDGAFGLLWQRHERAALRLARQVGNPSNAEDLVSESFARLLRVLRQGGGPDGSFRPYLFSTLRRLNIDNARSYSQRVSLTDDDTDLEGEPVASAAEMAAVNAENSAAWRAWASLPESSRTLLWHLVVEEETPAQIATLIGTSANGVSSRAVRARERLRQAFLQQHVAEAVDVDCRWTRSHLGEYVRGALSARDRSAVQAHLDDCGTCPAVLFEITDVNQTLRVVIAPVVLGGVALAAYVGAVGAAGSAGGAAAGAHAASGFKLFGLHLGSSTINSLLVGVGGMVVVGSIAAGVTIAAHEAPSSRVAASQLTPSAQPTIPAPTTSTPAKSTAATSTAATSTPATSTAAASAPASSAPVIVAPRPAIRKPTPRPTARTRTTVVPVMPATPAAPITPAAPTTPVPPMPTPTPPAVVTKSVTLEVIVLNQIYSGSNDTVDLSVPPAWTITLASAPIDPATCTAVSANEVRCLLPSVTSTGGPNGDGRYDFGLSAVGPVSDSTSQAILYYTDGAYYNHTLIDEQIINP